MTEVMAQPKTDMQYFDVAMKFAEDIRMIPLPVRKEKSGYLLNSMLVPLLFAIPYLPANSAWRTPPAPQPGSLTSSALRIA